MFSSSLGSTEQRIGVYPPGTENKQVQICKPTILPLRLILAPHSILITAVSDSIQSVDSGIHAPDPRRAQSKRSQNTRYVLIALVLILILVLFLVALLLQDAASFGTALPAASRLRSSQCRRLDLLRAVELLLPGGPQR